MEGVSERREDTVLTRLNRQRVHILFFYFIILYSIKQDCENWRKTAPAYSETAARRNVWDHCRVLSLVILA